MTTWTRRFLNKDFGLLKRLPSGLYHSDRLPGKSNMVQVSAGPAFQHRQPTGCSAGQQVDTKFSPV